MDSNTILAGYYRSDVTQLVMCNVQWMHEPDGDWQPICVYE